MSRCVPRLLALSFALACLLPGAASAQRVHVLAVTGLSGEPAYRLAFEAAASTLVDSAKAAADIAVMRSMIDPRVGHIGIKGRPVDPKWIIESPAPGVCSPRRLTGGLFLGGTF